MSLGLIFVKLYSALSILVNVTDLARLNGFLTLKSTSNSREDYEKSNVLIMEKRLSPVKPIQTKACRLYTGSNMISAFETNAVPKQS